MAIRVSLMDDELFRAAVAGDLSVLSEDHIAKHGESYYTEQTTPNGNNIIHIAVEHCQLEFVLEALAKFPELGRRSNTNKETPLHVAAMRGHAEIVKLLVSFEGCPTKEEEDKCHWPWMAETLVGDTPLHLAMSNNKLNVVMELLELVGLGSTLPLLSLVNAAGETPLHSFLKYCIGTHTTMEALLEEGVLNSQGEYKSKSQVYTKRSLSMMVESVLRELLKYKQAACMPDSDGLTPLLIAAQQGSFLSMRLILDYCRQSAEVSDPQGRTVLHLLKSHVINPSQKNHNAQDYDRDHHGGKKPDTDNVGSLSASYWKCKEFLGIPEINAIKDAKDSLGNTPSHVAITNRDFALVRVLFECFADFTIKNREGVSALELIKSCPDFATKMEDVIVTQKVFNQPLDKKLIQAVEKGTLFQDTNPEVDIESGEVTYCMDHDCLQGRTKGGLSILHLAVKHGQKIVVEKIIKLYPALVLTADTTGETPLHWGARLKKDHYPVATMLLQLTKDVVDKFRKEAGPLFVEALPWRQKNSEGDTPLHEALRSSNYDMAIKLMDIDSGLSSFENREGETTLHILARYGTYTKSDKIRALVEQLLSQNHSLVHKCDAQGFTPLLRAAHCGRIRVAYWIVQSNPSSAQFRDANGRTFLHLLRLEPTAELDYMTVDDMLYVYTNVLKLASGAEFDGLMRSQDNDGNTPLHFALKNNNLAAAKFLLLWCIESKARQELNIIDNDGRSVSNLLKSLADDIPYTKELKDLGLLAEKNIKDEVFGKKVMSSKVYLATVEGDQDLVNRHKQNHDTDSNSTHGSSANECKFSDDDIELLGNQVAPDGSNILHIACQHGKWDFAAKVLECYPQLLFERNSAGDTPLHSTAKYWKWDKCLDHDNFRQGWEKVCEEYETGEEGVLIVPPWRLKNSQGNTPLHEAIKIFDGPFAIELIAYDPEVAAYVNHAGQTPLHMCTDGESKLELLKWNPSAACVRDREGLTPLLRAAKTGDFWKVRAILAHSPESIQLRDHRGRSLLHLLHLKDDSISDSKELYEMAQVDALRKTEDFEGNTPLHSAILEGNSSGAKHLVNQFIKDGFGWARTQVTTCNNEGKSVSDLLATHDDAPNEIMQLLTMGGLHGQGLYEVAKRVRSSHGICASQIKDMANTLSVVAGLIATITFAAAFQVPGGFNGDEGSPVLLRRRAYQVFMISNSLAMCGSIIVLFSLLWVMFAGSVSHSFMLLDVSIMMLQFSLGATLISFMTGVYVTTSHGALNLAIFTCALCSIVILLMRKRFILAVNQFVRRLLRFYHFLKLLIHSLIELCIHYEEYAYL